MPRNAPGLDGAFTYAEGRAAGLSADELRHRGWSKPHHGVRSFREPTTVIELAESYVPRMKPEQYFSHTTSAIVDRFWLPLSVQERLEVHLAVPPGFRQPSGRLVRGHLLVERRRRPVVRRGLRVAHPVETWCQLATVLGLEDLIIAGESLLAKNRRDRTRLESLAVAVSDGDRPRQRLLERALAELREGSRSAKETQLRRILTAAGVEEPEINGDIFDALGTWVAECDLVFRRWKVVVEYEGAQHFERTQGRKDVRKYELLRALGWTVIRVVEDDLHQPAVVVARVAAALAAAARG